MEEWKWLGKAFVMLTDGHFVPGSWGTKQEPIHVSSTQNELILLSCCLLVEPEL